MIPSTSGQPGLDKVGSKGPAKASNDSAKKKSVIKGMTKRYKKDKDDYK